MSAIPALVATVIVSAMPETAIGQVPPPQLLPSQAFPQVPQGSPLPGVLPRRPAPVAPNNLQPQPVKPGQMPAVNVVVRSVAVTGASVYPQGDLTTSVAGLVGASVPLARIEAARVALLERYRSDGYVLTTVSASLDNGGNLRFVVVEGHIVEVKLEGDIGPAGVQVLRFLNHLTELPAVDTASLERWLLLANDIPGVTVQSVLRPSATDPGALTLVAQVERQAFSGLLTVDNRAFPLTGPVEGLGVLDLNSFTQLGERTELSLYHTSGNTQNFGQGSTEFFVGGSGLKARFYGGYGKSNPSDYLNYLGYEGFTTVFGASASYPVIRSREQTLNALAMFDLIESEIRTSATGVEERFGRDSIRVGRVGFDYALQDALLADDKPATNGVTFRLSQGLPFLGGTGNDNPLPTRINENTGFTKVAAQLSRTQTLFAPWEGATVALKGLLAGQYSGDVLPPVEKFYLGGSEFTRGFYSGEATGDKALAATVELQLNTTFDTTVFDRPLLINAQWYLFYDWGRGWQNQSVDPTYTLSSEGVGVRLNLTRYTEFDLEGVVRNTRLPVTTPGGGVSLLNGEAVYWRVLARF